MARRTKSDKLQIQVIARAASILRALEKAKAGLSLGELGKRLGLPRSTVQRIVAALHSEKLVVPASPTGGVRLGPTVLALASSMRIDFIAFARPYIERLSHELRETVDLSAIRNDHLVFLDQVVGPQRLRTVSAVGEKFPLHCTANGKAYLAQLESRAAQQLLGRQLARLTPRTLTSWNSLSEDLKKKFVNEASPMTTKNIRSAYVQLVFVSAIFQATTSPSPFRYRPIASTYLRCVLLNYFLLLRLRWKSTLAQPRLDRF